jgi:hypothetical protein
MRDPLKHGFYCVQYEYMEKQMNAVYFELKSAQEAMMKMMKKGVKCNGLNEWIQ